MLHLAPFDPDFVRDPHPLFRRFREEAPIYFWPEGQGNIFFRYRDVMALLREPRLTTDATLGAGYPAELRAAFPDFVALRDNDLQTVSPEAHARIRKLVNPLFGPRALEAHRPRVAEIIGEVIDALPREGVINVFADFARRYPVQVIASLLNIPPGDEATFIDLADSLIATLLPGMPPEVFASYMPAISRGVQLVRRLVDERRAEPIEGDLFSRLINACDEDERLSDGELLSLVSGLLVGGSDTTVHLTTYAILELLRHPDQLALVRADPSLARSALDETLRYNSFGRIGGLVRFPLESFTYEGVELHRGQPVYLNLLSAFRDPELVADPDVFDVRRRINSSPWFGYGPHFCVGASLARMEAEIALNRFLDRYPEIELAGEPVYGTHPLFRDIVDLPVRVRGATAAS
ncbi:MAG: cytochrome P450 [Myxococcales bacterium]|nr:cytochrome P450 [Myxococcales bacterium]